MLIIEKYKEEIKNYDFKGEDISCFLARLSLHKKYDDQCYRSSDGCEECLKNSLMELLKEHKEQKEPVKLTRFEYEYLKFAKKDGYIFIGRNKDKKLYFYKSKSLKCNDMWRIDNGGCLKFDFIDLFTFIKWEDEKPWNINDILANCKVTEDE